MTAPTTPSPERQPADAGGWLLPCPFCGSGSVVPNQVSTDGGWGILCRSCHANQDTRAASPSLAADTWNRRAPAPQAQPDARAVEGEPVARELRALVTAVTYAAPPKDFNGVLAYEARVPVEFVQAAEHVLSAPAADDGWRPSREEVARAIDPELRDVRFDGRYAPRSAMGLALAAADRVLALHPAAPTDEVGK